MSLGAGHFCRGAIIQQFQLESARRPGTGHHHGPLHPWARADFSPGL